MSDCIKTKDLFDCQNPHLKDLFDTCEYPWEILKKWKEYLKEMMAGGLLGYQEIAEDVWVGEGVTIAPTATVNGPAVIGAGCEIRPGAYLRGDVFIGEGCVIGNSTELKHCVIMDGVQVPHYNYVGDSVLGNRSHMGAGAICSNLKADKAPVIIRGEVPYETGLKKLGGILGDGADIGCGCVLNPGTVVGKNTSVYPLTALRGVYPKDSIVKGTREIVKRIK